MVGHHLAIARRKLLEQLRPLLAVEFPTHDGMAGSGLSNEVLRLHARATAFTVLAFPFCACSERFSATTGTIQGPARCRQVNTDWILEQVPFLTSLVGNDLLLGLAFFTLAATMMGFGVPGVLVPISFSSGALLGGWLGIGVVIVGALMGSHAFFLTTRHWLAARVRARWGHRLKRLDSDIGKRGFVYLLGLRLIGVPHVLVTAGSALSPIRARSFVLATALGFLPAITVAAMAGSAV